MGHRKLKTTETEYLSKCHKIGERWLIFFLVSVLSLLSQRRQNAMKIFKRRKCEDYIQNNSWECEFE